MAKKIVNIDDLLAANLLELTIKGRIYTVKDFDLETFLRVMSNPDQNPDTQKKVIQEQLALAFDVEKAELDDLGLRAMLLIVKEIRDWVIGDVEQIAGTDTENP